MRNVTNFERVMEFHRAFGVKTPDSPEFPDEKIQALRVSLIEEELNELKEAIDAKDLVGVADALTDLYYVVVGAADCFGIDIDACFREVHESNMPKLGEDGKPILREDGKILKGPNYFKPNLKKFISG